MDKPTYSLSYDIECHDPPIEIPDDFKRGACDTIVVLSILHCDGQEEMLDGTTSMATISQNGRTQQNLGLNELFQVWTTMAHELEQRLPTGGRKTMCKMVVEAMREVIHERPMSN